MESLAEANARLKRFERFGGVDLSRLFPEELSAIQTHARAGLAEFKKTVFSFYCEMCGRQENNDVEMEPMCTGPSWTDDHPPHVMTRKYQN